MTAWRTYEGTLRKWRTETDKDEWTKGNVLPSSNYVHTENSTYDARL